MGAARTRGPALRVGALKELGHEAEASLADVGAARENIEDGVGGAAKVGKSCDIWTGDFGRTDHRSLVLEQTAYLENGQKA